MKRPLSIALAFCLLACLAPGMAVAAAGAYTDITDPAVKEAAELLATLDIMDGVGGGRFDPEGTLNRAMLAAIGARIAGVRDISGYTSTVRFPDVRAGHWSHGWVMAAVDKGIMVGMPDGTFAPDGLMQFQFLITVLMRLLDYQDADVGFNWPHSYLNKAAAIGLTRNINYSPTYVPTRGQTALILKNFVSLKTKDGGPCYLDKNDAQSDRRAGVLLLRDINGTAYYLDENGTLTQDITGLDASLDGKAGHFVYGEDGRLLYFTPDAEYSYQTVTLDSANQNHLLQTDGTVTPVGANTRVITHGKDDQSYSAAKDGMWSGERLVLAYKGALLQYIYRDSDIFRQGMDGIKTCLRLLKAGTQTLALDNSGASYLCRDTLDSSLEGQTGLLLIDAELYAVSFTPDQSYTYRHITVKSAGAGGITTSEGTSLALTSALPVYTRTDSTNYGASYAFIAEGESLTVATNDRTGLTAYLFRHDSADGESGHGAEAVLRVMEQDGITLVLGADGSVHPLAFPLATEEIGTYGKLTLDAGDNAVAFSPNGAYSYKSVTLSESAAGGLHTRDDGFIQILASIPVWDADGAASSRYVDCWLDLAPGETLLLAYRPNGTMAYIYRGQKVSGRGEAVTKTLTTIPGDGVNPLAALFGTVTATVVKNGCVSDWKTLERYDVVSYYAAIDTAFVSNRRIMGRVHDMPDFSGDAPRLTVEGVSFPITEAAAARVLSLGKGTKHLFLLDNDGVITDIVSSSATKVAALATMEGLELAEGLTLPGTVLASGMNAQGLLGTVDTSLGGFQLTPFVSGKPGVEDWIVGEGKLGDRLVAPWCEIFERGGDNGAARRISLRDIPFATVPAANIKHVETGPSGYITLILLQDVSYDTYDFGFLQKGEASIEGGLGSEAQTCIWVTNGETTSTPLPCGNTMDGTLPGVVLGVAPGRSLFTGGIYMGGFVRCLMYEGLGRYDFTSDGYALIDSQRIPLDTQTVYTGTGTVSLDYARAQGMKITAYTDPGKIKVRLLAGTY